MNVSVETMSGLERRLTIALPSEDFESRITTKLEEARAQVRLPGFRPGKVPLKEVRRRFGQSVRADVAGELMQSSFFEAVTQEELNPAGQPSLEVVKMDPGIDFEFTATFEVFPVVEVADLTKVEVVKPSAQITDEDLENMVERLRSQRTTFEGVDRAAEEGDKVKLDFAGTLDGEPFEGGSGEDMEFEVGKGQMIEDFDQGVRGVPIGESHTFDAVFPDDYQAEDLQGKTAQFTITVKEVQAPTIPELDDEFFEAFGVAEGGEEAFREEVQNNMQREMDSALKNQIKQQVMDGLGKLHEFQLPLAIVQREIQVLKDQMLSQFQMGPQSQGLDLPDELFSDQAENRVKVGLVVNEIIAKEALEVDQVQLDARLEEIAAPYGETQQVIDWYRSNPEQMQNIEMGVLEDQVVDHIMSLAQVENLDSTYEDIISGKAIPVPEVEESEADAGEVEGEAALDDATITSDDSEANDTAEEK
ncbi:MAG: trigger factor [Pseudomonadota bacterium]